MCAGGSRPDIVGKGLRDLLKAVLLNFFFRCSSSQGMFSLVAGKGILSGRDGISRSIPCSCSVFVSLILAMADEYQSMGYGKVSGRIFVSVQAFQLKYSLSTLSQMYNGCRVT